MSATVSVQLEPDLKSRVDQLAHITATDPGTVVRQVVRHYLEVYASGVEAVQEGLRDVDADRLVDHDQVVAWVESWGGDNELERPK